MKAFNSNSANRCNVVVSLCDYSGNWPKPYTEAGYTVLCYDLKHGDDVNTLDRAQIMQDIAAATGNVEPVRIAGVLCAPPCTDFTVSGAQYWKRKDADGTTARSVAVVRSCLRIVDELNPAWWALENPVGRMPKLIPELAQRPYYFNPCDYAGYLETEEERESNRYTKRTGLWGSFCIPPVKRLEPIRVCKQGSWVQKLGGKSERTKELRSMTPMGFARAFAQVNR